MATTLTDTMDTLVTCVCAALEAADRPVCDCGLIVGSPEYSGFDRCCDCADGDGGGEVLASLIRVYPVDGYTFNEDTRLENCRPGAVAADIGIVVVRCYPSMNEAGQIPSLEVTTPFAENLNTDMTTVWNALKCCDIQLAIRDSLVQTGDKGGCSAFTTTVSALISLPDTAVVVES